jgi:excisionase family DNA binding protein
MEPADRAITEREAAQVLGLSVATLRAWRHRNRGPKYLQLGRAIRYRQSDLDEFVRDCLVLQEKRTA